MRINAFSPKEIINKIDNESSKFSRKKLQAFLLYREQISISNIALKMSKHISTIYNWINQIKKEGLDNLQIKKGRGLKSKLTDKQFDELKITLNKPIKTEDGYSRGWQSKDVVLLIKKKYGVIYSFSRVRELLHILGFSKIVCRPKSKRRNENLTNEFLENVKKKEIYWVMKLY